MKWRRGVLLAFVNLAAALPLILMLEARDARWLDENGKAFRFRSSHGPVDAAAFDRRQTARLARIQEEQTVEFSPCAMWVEYPVQEEVVRMGNLPAFTLTGWRMECPPAWSLSALPVFDSMKGPIRARFSARRRLDLALLPLIALQWFLVGGFPLIKTRKWWSEPGAAITCCTVLAAVLALIPVVDSAARFPAVFAAFGWLGWFGLLLWTALRFAFRSSARAWSSFRH